MTSAELASALIDFGLPAVLVLAIAYVLLCPEKAQLVAGWGWRFLGRGFRAADRRAVANRVEGRINAARKKLMDSIPEGVWEGKLKIKWTKADDAECVLREGEVLVCMQRSEHEEENIANGLIAYLPKAVLPRARRYVDPSTMQACDLVIAKSILSGEGLDGALDVLFKTHLDPARAGDELVRTRIDQVDELDMSGWLLRILLPEYRRLGDALHPGAIHRGCLNDAEEMRRWLCQLAARSPGDTGHSLSYPGRFFRVAVIFVAIKGRIETEGLKPYRRRTKRYLYNDRDDAIYLLARDDNISAVEDLAKELDGDGRIESIEISTYPLRADFKARKLNRERAIIACVRRRRGPGEVEITPDAEDLPSETYEFAEVEGQEGKVA